MCIKRFFVWLSTIVKSSGIPENVPTISVSDPVLHQQQDDSSPSVGNVDTETLLGRLPEIPHVATAMGLIVRALRIRR
jgi:hypothetical protein